MGNLVPVVDAREIKEDVRGSLWIVGKTGRAEGVLIFPRRLGRGICRDEVGQFHRIQGVENGRDDTL